jgi:hypothetical protein
MAIDALARWTLHQLGSQLGSNSDVTRSKGHAIQLSTADVRRVKLLPDEAGTLPEESIQVKSVRC